MKNFKDKIAAITGAGSGIGRALALNLAQKGCHLALSDINQANLAETVKQAEQFGVKITQDVVDVAQEAQVKAWADQTAKTFGKVNLIFNNAGVALGATVDGMKREDFEWLMNINFWGVVNGTQAFLPHLKTAGEGHIINISSIFGLAGIPTQSAYNAAKFAVRGFTESLRQELDMMRCGVSATSVHPGGIKTNIARAARMDKNVSQLGLSAEKSTQKFEKQFITSADKAAAIIIRAVEKDSRRVLVGPDAVVFDLMIRFLPSSYQRIVTHFTAKRM